MISENLDIIKSKLNETVTLVAVSKTKPNEMILEAYQSGQRIFGENKVQELVEKQETLPKDIKWHMIGHLQSNKVKYIAPFVSLIHGIDSPKLLKEINKQARKNERTIDVLLQFHIATESTKFGFSLIEVQELLSSEGFSQYKNIRICGVMGMASYTSDTRQVAEEFKQLKEYYNSIQAEYFNSDTNFSIISMGMSGDFEIAIAQGSTMVRVGSSIFGDRNYI